MTGSGWSDSRAVRLRGRDWYWGVAEDARPDLAPVFRPLLHRLQAGEQPKYRWLAFAGGRNGMKTWAVARVFALLAASVKGIRLLAGREVMRSVRDSNLRAIADAIGRDEQLAAALEVQTSRIVHRDREAGGEILFAGLNPSAPASMHSIKGLEGIDIAWIDEAQHVTPEGLDLLEPTVRKDGSQLWFTLNPKRTNDAVYTRYVVRPPPEGCYTGFVNVDANPWESESALASRLRMEREDPDLYAHVYLGEPLDELAGELTLLYRADVRRCFTAWADRPSDLGEHHVEAGLDVADVGRDLNCFAVRAGPALLHVESWTGRGKTLGWTVGRALELCQEHGVDLLSVDGSGVGAGARSHLVDAGADVDWKMIGFGDRPDESQVVLPRPDGAPPGDGDSQRLNFANRGAQLAWELKARVANTRRLAFGEPVEPARALYMAPALADVRGFVDQLCRPTWAETSTGLRKVDKTGGQGGASPDMFDAVRLSFGHSAGVESGYDSDWDEWHYHDVVAGQPGSPTLEEFLAERRSAAAAARRDELLTQRAKRAGLTDRELVDIGAATKVAELYTAVDVHERAEEGKTTKEAAAAVHARLLEEIAKRRGRPATPGAAA